MTPSISFLVLWSPLLLLLLPSWLNGQPAPNYYPQQQQQPQGAAFTQLGQYSSSSSSSPYQSMFGQNPPTATQQGQCQCPCACSAAQSGHTGGSSTSSSTANRSTRTRTVTITRTVSGNATAAHLAAANMGSGHFAGVVGSGDFSTTSQQYSSQNQQQQGQPGGGAAMLMVAQGGGMIQPQQQPAIAAYPPHGQGAANRGHTSSFTETIREEEIETGAQGGGAQRAQQQQQTGLMLAAGGVQPQQQPMQQTMTERIDETMQQNNLAASASAGQCGTSCEAGWHYFNCFCYQLVVRPEGMTWAQAVQNGRTMGANLASVHSAAENEFLAQMTKLIHPGTVLVIDERPSVPTLQEGSWLGMTRDPPPEGPQGNWICKWSDGTPVDYGGAQCTRPMGPGQRPWGDDQPDNRLHTEGCVFMVSYGTPSQLYGQWGDYECTRRFMGAYYKKPALTAGAAPPQQPLPSPSANLQLVERIDESVHDFSSQSTQCNTSCAPGWHYFNCNCYQLVVRPEGMSYAQATQNCRAMGANLASIHSAGENDFMASLSKLIHPGVVLVIDERPAAPTPQEGAWLGMTRDPSAGGVQGSWNCRWSDGTPMNYGVNQCTRPAGPGQRPWSDDQPNNNIPGEGCTFMVTYGTPSQRYGQWGNNDCNRRYMGAYCKKPALTAPQPPPMPQQPPSQENCGWHYRDGHCYKLTIQDHGVNQSQARSVCQALNADLPSVHSQEENLFIASVSVKYPEAVMLCPYPYCSDVVEQVPLNIVAQGYWLGMVRSRDRASGLFRCSWTDNTPVDYPGSDCPQTAAAKYPWSPLTPDYYLEQEECVHQFPFHSSYYALWNDWNCRFKLKGVMCKKPCTDPCQA